MRNYEVAFIAHPELDEASFAALVEKAQGWVTAAGGQVTKTDIWGRRRMAYSIRKQTEGQYVLLEAQLDLNSKVVRGAKGNRVKAVRQAS